MQMVNRSAESLLGVCATRRGEIVPQKKCGFFSTPHLFGCHIDKKNVERIPNRPTQN